MCLSLTVYLSPRDAPSVEQIASAVSAASALAVRAIKRGWARKATLTISEEGEGCACSLLADSADWDAETWDMRPEVLPELVKALRELDARCQDGFEMDALWAGDAVEATVTVTVGELAKLVAHGELGNKVRYCVRQDEPSIG